VCLASFRERRDSCKIPEVRLFVGSHPGARSAALLGASWASC